MTLLDTSPLIVTKLTPLSTDFIITLLSERIIFLILSRIFISLATSMFSLAQPINLITDISSFFWQTSSSPLRIVCTSRFVITKPDCSRFTTILIFSPLIPSML